VPPGWTVSPAGVVALKIDAFSAASLTFAVEAPPAAIGDTNRCTLALAFRERPALPELPLVILGGFRWLMSPALAGTLETAIGLDETAMVTRSPSNWSESWRAGNDLELEVAFKGAPGVIYLLHFIDSPVAQEVIVGVSNTSRMKLWLNGTLEHETSKTTGLRPNQGNGGGDGANYKTCHFRAGSNQILIKIERGAFPLQAHFTLGRPDRKYFKCLGHAVLGLGRSSFPWEPGHDFTR
jgi:hypothetical protein